MPKRYWNDKSECRMTKTRKRSSYAESKDPEAGPWIRRRAASTLLKMTGAALAPRTVSHSCFVIRHSSFVIIFTNVIKIAAPDFDLEKTLYSGQVFHWQNAGEGFVGTI